MTAKLNKTKAIYLAQIKFLQDSDGWIDFKCDGLGFNSLLACLPEFDVDLDAAFDEGRGLWHRRPLRTPCFDCATKTDVGSKSSISRDMLLMLAWSIFYNGRIDLSEQVIKYALSHKLIMGEAVNLRVKLGRCLMSLPLLSTYAWISYRLGGPSRWWLRWIPTLASSRVVDYQAHLAVLHGLLRDRLTETSPPAHQNLYAEHAARNPENALFQYAAGDSTKALAILSDPRYFPENRLPNSNDRKTGWLWERDQTDYVTELDKPSKQHSGGDFLWMMWLIHNY